MKPTTTTSSPDRGVLSTNLSAALDFKLLTESFQRELLVAIKSLYSEFADRQRRAEPAERTYALVEGVRQTLKEEHEQ
ncbi:hypothetical protein ACXX9E_29415 [Pseudomonas sp. GNP014]